MSQDTHIIPDDLLDRIIAVGQRIDSADMQLDEAYAHAEKWQEYREEYNRLDVALSEAEANITLFEKKLKEEPDVADIVTRLAEFRNKASKVVDSDPMWAEITILDRMINDIRADGRRPWVQKRDAAKNEKRAYLRFMAEPQNKKYRAAWERFKKENE